MARASSADECGARGHCPRSPSWSAWCQRALRVGRVDRGEETLLARLTGHAADLRGLLGVDVARTRQLLGATLAGPVTMMPSTEAGRRGYRFSGLLQHGGLHLGDRLETRDAVVAPTGFEPVFQP